MFNLPENCSCAFYRSHVTVLYSDIVVVLVLEGPDVS